MFYYESQELYDVSDPISNLFTQGKWMSGRRQGEGVLYQPDGFCLIGKWRDNKIDDLNYSKYEFYKYMELIRKGKEIKA